MANVKDIYIEAEVPFHWISELDANQAVLFTPITMNPVWGLSVHFTDIGYRDNDHGGKTSMYKMVIQGTEAVRTTYVDAMIDAIESVKEAKVLKASEYDLENHEGWTIR